MDLRILTLAVVGWAASGAAALAVALPTSPAEEPLPAAQRSLRRAAEYLVRPARC